MLDRKTPPPLLPYPRLAIPFPEETILENDIHLLTLNHGDWPVNRITILWSTGLCDVTDREAASILPLIMREGSESFSGAEISETLDFNGAWLRINIQEHYTSLNLFSLNRSTENLFPLLDDIISRPIFPSDAINAIASRLAMQYEVNLRKVSFQAANTCRKNFFGKNHPLAVEPEIEALMSVDQRRLQTVFDRIIATSLPTVYLAGEIDTNSAGKGSSVRELTTGFLSGIDTGRMALREPKIIKPAPAPGVYTKEMECTQQAAVDISIPSIDRSHPDYIKLRFAAMALGGYFGSRLMKNIREDKGYTYGISANMLGYREGGLLNISSQTDSRYIQPLIDETFAEITRIQSEPISPEELHSLKAYAMSNLATLLDSPFTIADHHILNRMQHIVPDYFNRQIEALESLDSEEIAALLKKHIDTTQAVVAIAK